jgi:phosphoribosyl 1,2-cyclic phosphodiesterase
VNGSTHLIKAMSARAADPWVLCECGATLRARRPDDLNAAFQTHRRRKGQPIGRMSHVVAA